MAEIEENQVVKPSTKTSSLFNRSMTMHSVASTFSKKPFISPPPIAVDRNASMKKWYDSFESAGTSLKGKVRQLRTLFESPKSLNLPSPTEPSPKIVSNQSFNKLKPTKSFSTDLRDAWSILDASTIRFPGTEDRVVVYFTSLRGVRRTFEDCYTVRLIFRGYRVFVDERDISMDAAYRKELQGLLGEKNVSLPQVFIKGTYVGGVDVIRQLNETGELRKLLQVLPMRDRNLICDACGDVRFLPCPNCNGSRKVFDEDEELIKRCLECNENGLIRCPECCS